MANTLGMTAKVSQYSNQGNHAKKCRAVVLAGTLRKQVNQNSLGLSFRLGFEGWPGGANKRQGEEERLWMAVSFLKYFGVGHLSRQSSIQMPSM